MRAAPIRRCRLAAALVMAVLGSTLLAACGPQATSRATTASLVLDFTPNAIHAGIYEAIARSYDRDAGVALHVIVPTASTDAIQLLSSGRSDFAILDIHDLAIARAAGNDLVGVMAIVQRPLAAVIAAARFRTPRALDGQLVGVSGDPSDLAVLRSIVAGAGGSVARLRTITIGFNAVADLLSGRVAAATAFWNDEGVTLAGARPGAFRVFRVEAYGAPAYPELVLCATRSWLAAHARVARAVVHALVRGYSDVIADPRSGERALESAVGGLDAALVAAQLTAELPAFRSSLGVGSLDLTTLRAWAVWEKRFGIVRSVPDVSAMFDETYLH